MSKMFVTSSLGLFAPNAKTQDQYCLIYIKNSKKFEIIRAMGHRWIYVITGDGKGNGDQMLENETSYYWNG